MTTQIAVFAFLACLCIGLASLWDATRSELVQTKKALHAVTVAREADNAALELLQQEKAEITERYTIINQELADLKDEESSSYLNTPVPSSVRRLLGR